MGLSGNSKKVKDFTLHKKDMEDELLKSLENIDEDNDFPFGDGGEDDWDEEDQDEVDDDTDDEDSDDVGLDDDSE